MVTKSSPPSNLCFSRDGSDISDRSDSSKSGDSSDGCDRNDQKTHAKKNVFIQTKLFY